MKIPSNGWNHLPRRGNILITSSMTAPLFYRCLKIKLRSASGSFMKFSFQQRRFLNTKDAAFPAVISNSLKSSTSKQQQQEKNRALLLFAAEEAERTLLQLSKLKEYYQLKSNEVNIRHGESDRIVQKEMVEASEKLLMVSNSTAALQELIYQKRPTDAGQISTLHRAFLVLTTRCLDCIQIMSNLNEKALYITTEILMDQALMLTRRAHELGFPFHLPLYQRLMEAVVTTHSKTAKIPDTIFEIAGFTDTLGGTTGVDSELFRPAILALIDEQNFSEVINVMNVMKDRHDIQFLEPQTTFDIFTRIYETTKLSFTARDFPDFMADVREIVQMLEPSLYKLEAEARKVANNEEDNFRRELEKCVSDLDEDDTESLLSQIDEQGDESVEEYDNDNDDESVDEIDDESSTPPLDNDDYYILAALTKGVVSFQARKSFLDMIKYGRVASKNATFSGEKSLPLRIVYLPKKQELDQDTNLSDLSDEDDDEDDDEAEIDLDIQVAKEEDHGEEDRGAHEKDADIDQDSESVPDDDDGDYKLLTQAISRSQNDEKLYLPDITDQLLSLNNGRKLQFTSRFKSVIWNRDSEEEDIGLDYSPLAGYRPFADDDEDDDSGSDGDYS